MRHAIAARISRLRNVAPHVREHLIRSTTIVGRPSASHSRFVTNIARMVGGSHLTEAVSITPEEIALWSLGISLLVALATIVGLLWKIHIDSVKLKKYEENQHRQDQMYRVERWNDEVYKRWLNVFVNLTEDDNLEFRIPRLDVEENPRKGEPLTEIPGFELATGHLVEWHPDVSNLWTKAEKSLEDVDEHYRQRYATVKRIVMREMGHHFQLLTGKNSRHPLQANSFHWDVIAKRVCQRSHILALGGRSEPSFNIKTTQEELPDGTAVWVLGNASIYLVRDSTDVPDVEEFTTVLGFCAKDDDSIRAASAYIRSEKDLEKSLTDFTTALEKVVFDIDSRLEESIRLKNS